MRDNQYHSDDQISFDHTGSSIKSVFRLFFRFISLLATVIRKNIPALLAFIILGGVIGFGLFLRSPRNFKAEMILKHSELTKQTFNEMIGNLQKLIETGSSVELSKELKISPSTSSSIKGIKTVSMNDDPLGKDTSTRTIEPFKLLVVLSDNNITDSLQVAIITYLNNNPYLKAIKEGQRKIYDEKLEYIVKQQLKLDTLKDNYNKFLLSSKAATTFFNNTFNPAELYIQSDLLQKEKDLTLKWYNTESKAVTVVDGFKQPANSDSWGLRQMLIAGMFYGFIAGLVILCLAAIERKLN